MGSQLAVTFGRGTYLTKPSNPNQGYFYFATDHGILYRYSGSAWESVSSRGLSYEFSTTTTDADPGVGKIRFNHATPASVTILYLDDQCLNADADLGTVWDNITGARLLITQADDPDKYLLVEVTADADGTGYWKLTSTVDDSGTLPDDGSIVNVQIIGGGGGGGGGGTTNWWDEKHAYYQCRWNPGAGFLTHGFGEEPLLLQSGTLDSDGRVGAGGFTDTTVPCSCFYDTTPANLGSKGIKSSNTAGHVNGLGRYMRVIARFPEDGDQTLYLGQTASFWNAAGLVSDHALFMKLSTDTNWQCRSADGTTEEITDSGVAWATGDWHIFEIYVYDDSGTMTAKYWIDGTLVATHTTNAPLSTGYSMIPLVISLWTSADVSTNDAVFFCSEFVTMAKGAAHDLGRATL